MELKNIESIYFLFDTKNVKIENLEFANTAAGESSANIIFGKTSGVTHRWLLADELVKDENLTATFTFDVNLYNNYDEDADTHELGTGDIKDYVSVIELDLVSTGIADAVDAGYITAPVVTYTYGEDDNESTGSIDYGTASGVLSIDMSDATGNTVEVTVTIEFGWGEAFGNQNPYAYYNASGRNPADAISDEDETTWAEHADAALSALANISGAKYEVTLTAKIAD